MTISSTERRLSILSANYLKYHAFCWWIFPWSKNINESVAGVDWNSLPDISALERVAIWTAKLSGWLAAGFIVIFVCCLQLEESLHISNGPLKILEYAAFAGWFYEGCLFCWTGFIIFIWEPLPDEYKLKRKSRIWILWLSGAPMTISISLYTIIWVLSSKI